MANVLTRISIIFAILIMIASVLFMLFYNGSGGRFVLRCIDTQMFPASIPGMSLDTIDGDKRSNVVYINDHRVLYGGTWFIYVYAPWKYTRSEDIEDSFQILSGRKWIQKKNITIAFLNSLDHPGISALLEIVSYPSIRLISNGTVSQCYCRNKTLASLEEHLYTSKMEREFSSPLAEKWPFWYEMQIRLFHIVYGLLVRVFQ